MRIVPGLGGVRGGAVRPSLPLPRLSPLNHGPCLRVAAAPSKIGHTAADEAIVLDLNYAQLLGLRGRELYLDPQITAAHDALVDNELDAAYSSVARLGKEKLLYAAREGLRVARGRVSLIHPDIAVEPALLPGAMALLEQAGQYELVIQLAQQAVGITSRDLRPGNRAAAKDFRRDVALATALAHCGLAKRDLDVGQPALACARLEEALYLLKDAAGVGSAPLAPELQANIVAALGDLKADAILDVLGKPLDLAEVSLRRQALAALKGLLKQNGGGAVSADYAARALTALSSEEIVALADWKRLAGNPPAWAPPALLAKAGLAHIVAGFATRRPETVAAGRGVLRAARAVDPSVDVAVQVAVAEVLLGAPLAALDILKEDERHGVTLRAKAGLPPAPARAARSALSKAAAAARLSFPDRDGVMAFVRAASPDGEADLLPGLCLFVEQWLQRLAFSQFRDTDERPPLASLAAYFEDPHAEAYLEAREGAFSLGRAKEAVSGAVRAVVAALDGGVLGDKRALYAAGAAAAVVAALVLGREGIVANQRAVRSGQAPGGAAAAGSRRTAPTTSPAATAARSARLLTKDAALSLIKEWLSIKAEAMGPRHVTARLSSVLAEPMLGAVTSEAREAASSGWFWNIRPLRARVDSIDESGLTLEGAGAAVVVATVEESADLWASNGKKGDSYKTEYKVEYVIVKKKDGWRVASALVLGR